MINVFRLIYSIKWEIASYKKQKKRKKVDKAATLIDQKDKKPTYANKKELSNGNL